MRYIALLRGINVGGNHIIKMTDLKGSFEKLGFTSVKTYIQSGNVVFEAKDRNISSLKEKIEEKLKGDYGFDVPAILRAADEIHKLVACKPFAPYADEKDTKLYVYFLDSVPENFPDLPTPIDKEGFQMIGLSGADALVIRRPVAGTIGYADKSIAKMLKGTYTARNWNTVISLSTL
jgi:uncharacterized protein (DUF1697 family)